MQFTADVVARALVDEARAAGVDPQITVEMDNAQADRIRQAAAAKVLKRFGRYELRDVFAVARVFRVSSDAVNRELHCVLLCAAERAPRGRDCLASLAPA